MVYQNWPIRLLALCAALCTMVFAVPAALAGGGPQQQIDNLRGQLDELEDSAPEGVGEDDFATANQWLDEAEQRHNRGRSSGVEQRIRRVDHTLDLLRAQIEITNIERSTESQHEAYEQMLQQVEDLREDIASLENQKKERQRELERVRSDD